MAVADLAWAVVLSIAIGLAVSVGIGATAPRWPSRWLRRDVGPLVLTRFDTPVVYRRLHAGAWSQRLPELGAAFGGRSKRALPGHAPTDLEAHLVEARRAEWVHWLSMLSLLPVALVGPWWLWLAFAAVVVAVNLVFILVIRFNRVRLTSILERMAHVD